MNYSDSPAMCEVNFFKDTGKWYGTEAINMTTYWEKMNYSDEFRKVLKEQVGTRLEGMTAVCLHPYNKNECPVMCVL